jgi:hypothetical protein
MYSGEYDVCNVILRYTLRVTSQTSYSPEYITPTQKNKFMIKTDHETCLLEIMDKMTLEHKGQYPSGQYILGDFNIDLQSSKSKSTTFSKRVLFTLGLGLKQLVTVSTRTEARYVDGHSTSPQPRLF